VPQCESVRNVGKAKHFLDSSVTIRRHDENGTGKIGSSRWNPDDDVVMKLSLLPVTKELVSTPAVANAIKERAKDE
jgi:hypothetical protein